MQLKHCLRAFRGFVPGGRGRRKGWLASALAPGWLSLFGVWLATGSGCAQSAAFTYQGRLNEGAGPAQGTYAFQFSLYNAATAGTLVAGPLAITNVAVAEGLFAVRLDFGANTFDGTPRWLEISVRTNSPSASSTRLTPRQEITAAPYAVRAAAATQADSATQAAKALSLTGVLPDANLAANVPRFDRGGTFSGTLTFSPAAGPPFAVGNASLVRNLNADLLDGLHGTNFWQTRGNAGTTPGTEFVGTSDDRALEFKVNLARALRLEPHPSGVNVIGGAGNNLAVTGVSAATIAGGYNNLIRARGSFIGGGLGNTVEANADFATMGGGSENSVGAGASYAVVPGGRENLAAAPYALAAGRRAKANHPGAFVWADTNNFDFPSEQPNQFRVRAAGGLDFVTALDNLGRPTTDVRMTSTGGVSIAAATVTSPALELRQGAIRVKDAGVATPTPAFIHRSHATNCWYNASVIHHPLSNGDPRAILLVTVNDNPGDATGANGPALNSPLGVHYLGTRADVPALFQNRWAIYTRDGMTMPTNGVAFNILIVKP